MTLDDLFINTATHLAAQTERCMNKDYACVYAGSNGNACGVGCNLPRDLAEAIDRTCEAISWTTIEDWATFDIATLEPECLEKAAICRKAVSVFSSLPLPKEDRLRLLSNIQSIHDSRATRTADDKLDMLRTLRNLADAYGATKSAHTKIVELISHLQGGVS